MIIVKFILTKYLFSLAIVADKIANYSQRLFHKNGFPGGLLGVIMVILWSLALGVIRYRTKDLIGVLIAHFFADFTIYMILYGLK